MSFSLTQLARRRITQSPVVAGGELDDLTALAVAVGVMDEPTALAAVIGMMTAPSKAATARGQWDRASTTKEMGHR